MSVIEAMKLALEALKWEEAQTAYPSRMMTNAITALQKALANEALDKKAENARELGLDYEPAPVAELREQEPVPAAMKTVIQAMQQDPDYAWSWHCNIAMAFVDAGGDHYTGNQGAARFMKMLANVEPAHELPSPQPAQRTWVGLTDEERAVIGREMAKTLPNRWIDFDYARAVEAKLKEKNT